MYILHNVHVGLRTTYHRKDMDEPNSANYVAYAATDSIQIVHPMSALYILVGFQMTVQTGRAVHTVSIRPNICDSFSLVTLRSVET